MSHQETAIKASSAPSSNPVVLTQNFIEQTIEARKSVALQRINEKYLPDTIEAEKLFREMQQIDTEVRILRCQLEYLTQMLSLIDEETDGYEILLKSRPQRIIDGQVVVIKREELPNYCAKFRSEVIDRVLNELRKNHPEIHNHADAVELKKSLQQQIKAKDERSCELSTQRTELTSNYSEESAAMARTQGALKREYEESLADSPLAYVTAGNLKKVKDWVKSLKKSERVGALNKSYFGFCLLHEACKYGYIDLTAFLLSEGANPQLIDQLGRNAFDYAHDSGCYDQIFSKTGCFATFRKLFGGKVVGSWDERRSYHETVPRVPRVYADLNGLDNKSKVREAAGTGSGDDHQPLMAH